MRNTTELNFKQARNVLCHALKNPYAWPGGYEVLIVCNDGGLLCAECVKKEARRIMSDIRDGYDTGWYPAGTVIEAVSPDCTGEELMNTCDHCGKMVGELGA